MTHSDLIDRVIAIMANSDRTPRVRAEEVVALVMDRGPWLFDPTGWDKEHVKRLVEQYVAPPVEFTVTDIMGRQFRASKAADGAITLAGYADFPEATD